MKTIRIILIALALALPIPACWFYTTELNAVDTCLDQGGSYDYESMKCDFEQTHERIPFSERHPYIWQNAAFMFALFGFLFLTTFKFGIKAEPAN